MAPPSRRRTSQSGLPPKARDWVICKFCGKRGYRTRKAAKAGADARYPDGKLSAYRCLHIPEGAAQGHPWHVGHLSEAVVRGDASREEYYVKPGEPLPDQKPEEQDMPTIREAASLKLGGLFKDVDLTSPVEDKVALVHAGLRLYAYANSFSVYWHDGVNGFTGRAELVSIIREQFDLHTGGRGQKDIELEQLVTGIVHEGERAGLFTCLDKTSRRPGESPLWWVAESYEEVVGHPVLAKGRPPKPSAPSKRPEPPVAPQPPEDAGEKKYRGRAPGSRNRARIEVLSLAERTLYRLGRAVLLEELYASADFPIQKTSLRDVLDELVRERKVVKRLITDEDRVVLKAAGGPSNRTPQTNIYVHRSFADTSSGKAVPGVVTWGLNLPVPVPVPTQGREPDLPLAVLPKPEPEPTEVDYPDDVDDIDARIAFLEQEATRASQTEAGELDRLRAENARLEAQVAKLTTQRDRLLAVVETMKD